MSIATSVLSIVIGGGLFAFVQFLINRHDAKHDRLKEVIDSINDIKKDVTDIKTEIGKVRDEADRREAIHARTHILRFRDELSNDIEHSSEYFDQVLDDAKFYDKFCSEHKDFLNGRTEAAIEYIREEEKRLRKEHKL